MTCKDKVFVTGFISFTVSTVCLFLMTPGEWWFGCSMWLIMGVWFAWTAELFLFIIMVRAFVRLICGIIHEMRLSRRHKDDAVELYGVSRYVTRDAVCRASKSDHVKSFVRL